MADATKSPKPAPRSVIIRSRPKIIFLYPTMLAALAAGIWTMLAMHGVPLDQVTLTPGRLFWWTFAANLAAMAFDFTRGEFIGLVLFFGLCFVSIVLLDDRFALVRPVQEALSTIQLRAHPHLYFMISGAMAVTFALVLGSGRFDYWELTNNELMHHRGLLGDVERWPAPNLRMTKEITDVFEHVLLRSGRLVFQPQGSPRAIVLEHVAFVNTIERDIERMLSQLAVTLEPPAQKAPEA